MRKARQIRVLEADRDALLESLRVFTSLRITDLRTIASLKDQISELEGILQ